MQSKWLHMLCLICLLMPLATFAAEEAQEKSFGEKVGETTGDVQTGMAEGYEATKEAVGDGTDTAVEKSKSVYESTVDGIKQFWEDVKKGYNEATD
jgi:hypothetical protein